MKTFQGWRDAGQAMRWARATHPKLTVHTRTVDRTGARRTVWETGTSRVSVIRTADGEVGAVSAFTVPGAASASCTIRNAEQVLDLLVGLGMLPARYAGAYHIGRADGAVELAQDLIDAKATYDVVVATGKAAFRPGGESRA